MLPRSHQRYEKQRSQHDLGGGFKYFLFSPLFGEDSHFDSYFSKGLKPPTSDIWIKDVRLVHYSNTCSAWPSISKTYTRTSSPIKLQQLKSYSSLVFEIGTCRIPKCWGPEIQWFFHSNWDVIINLKYLYTHWNYMFFFISSFPGNSLAT